MRTLTQTVTTADFLSGHDIELFGDYVSRDSVTGDVVTIDIIDGCAIVDSVHCPTVTRYNDGVPIFPTDGGDWMLLHGCLRATIAIHLLRMGYRLFVFGRNEIDLVITC